MFFELVIFLVKIFLVFLIFKLVVVIFIGGENDKNKIVIIIIMLNKNRYKLFICYCMYLFKMLILGWIYRVIDLVFFFVLIFIFIIKEYIIKMRKFLFVI